VVWVLTFSPSNAASSMENLVISLPMVATTQITMSAGNDAMVAAPSTKWILSLMASHPVSGG
jgi:hypothetical protein